MSLVNTAQPSIRPAHTSSRAAPGRGLRDRDEQAEQAAHQERRHRRLEHHPGVVAQQERVKGEDEARRTAATRVVAQRTTR